MGSGVAVAGPITKASFGVTGTFSIEPPKNTFNLGNNKSVFINGLLPPHLGFSTLVNGPGTGSLAGAVNFLDVGHLKNLPNINNIGGGITSFLTLADGINFDLSSLTVQSRIGNFKGPESLVLFGTGLLSDTNIGHLLSPTIADFSFVGTSTNNELFTYTATVNIDPPAVPEPAALVLFGGGLLGLGVLRRRMKAA